MSDAGGDMWSGHTVRLQRQQDIAREDLRRHQDELRNDERRRRDRTDDYRLRLDDRQWKDGALTTGPRWDDNPELMDMVEGIFGRRLHRRSSDDWW